jgi:hypothetical protein
MMPKRLRRISKILTLALALPFLSLSKVEGQSSDSVSVSVFVADGGTARPIPNVRVEFPEMRLAQTTDSLGDAYFKLKPGLARIRATKIGYQVARETFIVGLSQGLDVTIGLKKLDPSQVLDTVSIRATRPPAYLQEFENRRALGLGTFITSAELDSSKHERFADLATRKLRGVRAEWDPNSARVKLFSLRGYLRFRLNNNRCATQVYLDDEPIDEYDLASIVTGDLAAVEYYTSAPPVKYSKAGSLCGVIVAWTKR